MANFMHLGTDRRWVNVAQRKSLSQCALLHVTFCENEVELTKFAQNETTAWPGIVSHQGKQMSASVLSNAEEFNQRFSPGVSFKAQ